MNPYLVATILIIYFAVLFFIAKYTSKGTDESTFFTANRASPWYLVAFGMIGASLSGVTFISVPGEVGNSAFSYLQFVMGNVVGYWAIAYFLLPLYYRLNVVSIYQFLETRLGKSAYKTGAFFFIISKIIGAAFRLFLVAVVLQVALFEHLNIPFAITVTLSVLLIWLYTYKGGIKTVVWTDTLQTFFLLAAAVLTVITILNKMDLSIVSGINAVWDDTNSTIFDWNSDSKGFFWKQFIAGIFITIVMNGFDQDIMQKNLTCKNKGEARKNMVWFSIAFFISVIMLMSLGVLLYQYAAQLGIELPERSDNLYPTIAMDHLGLGVGVFFILGITAAAYSSADSALTALTTSFCFDFLDFANRQDEDVKKKHRLFSHIGFSIVLIIVVVVFDALNDESVVMAVFKAASYTYGPILGLFLFAFIFRRELIEKMVPVVCVLSPILCYLLSTYSERLFNGYQFGFELLLVNGAITVVGLFIFSKKVNH